MDELARGPDRPPLAPLDGAGPHGWLPPPAPLACPIQRLETHVVDPAAPGWRPRPGLAWWRAAVLLAPLLATVAYAAALGLWFSAGGLSLSEAVLTGLAAFTFFWIALAVGNASVGLVAMVLAHRHGGTAPAAAPDLPPLRVAVLVPVHNEDPALVFGNLHAILTDLGFDRPGSENPGSENPGSEENAGGTGRRHRFELYVLSDTTDDRIAAGERRAFAALRAAFPGRPVWYRRRAHNIGKKAGNIGQWVSRFGSRHDAMVVLDADSLMTGAALRELADALSADPAAGLVQTAPQLVGSRTLYGRLQEFAAGVHGPPMARGLAAWTDGEGNFWGHNAIIRIGAFAASAGLPPMPRLPWARRRGGGLILSHDFVEAALMRRAGWAIRFRPDIAGSYESPPPSLIDFSLRDRRWCHGNLQHLAVLTRTRGLHPVSALHMVQGAMSYLMAPAWFALMLAWALLGNGENSVARYFTEANPLYPAWPTPMGDGALVLLAVIYGLLLAPKLIGLAALPFTWRACRHGRRREGMGGLARLLPGALIEIVLAVVLAPVLMVQQLLAVLRTLAGFRPRWSAARREGGGYRPGTVLRFHALETTSGLILLAGIAAGFISPWLLPLAASLLLAVPLSLFTAGSGGRLARLLQLPEPMSRPPILRSAEAARPRYRAASVGAGRPARPDPHRLDMAAE